MKKLLRGLQYIESAACITIALVMLFACGLQVFNRNITQQSIKWTEELARYSMVWLAMIGSSIGLREGKQMSVEFFYMKMPSLTKRFLRIVGDIVCIAFFAVTGYCAVITINVQFNMRQMAPALVWPVGAIYIIMPVAMFAMMSYELFQLFMDLTGRNEAVLATIEAAEDDTDAQQLDL